MQIEKDNHLFYYHLPADRFADIILFRWFAIWYGHQYAWDLDLHLSQCTPETIALKTEIILLKLELSFEKSFSAIEKNPPQPGILNAIFEPEDKGWYCSRKSTGELLTHLAINEGTPGMLRQALKAHLEAAQ
jgi:hypothetical protein